MDFFRILMRIMAGFFLLTCLLCLFYRVVNPVSTLMLKRWAFGQAVEYHYVPMNHMSPNLVEAVIVAEDGRFCMHHGVDWNALQNAVVKALEESGTHGASTITMQAARNLFLWQGRSYVRKVIEIPLSLMVDAVLGKQRTMEIYLNIAEWGKGLFGAEAASQHYFHKSVRHLTAQEAALLVAVLPSPTHRNPGDPGVYTRYYAEKIAHRIQTNSALTQCLR